MHVYGVDGDADDDDDQDVVVAAAALPAWYEGTICSNLRPVRPTDGGGAGMGPLPATFAIDGERMTDISGERECLFAQP